MMQNPSGSNTKGLRRSLRNLTSDFDQIGIATIKQSAIRGMKIRASSFSFVNLSCRSRTSLVRSLRRAAWLAISRFESGEYWKSVIDRRPVRAPLRGRPLWLEVLWWRGGAPTEGRPYRHHEYALRSRNQRGGSRRYKILLPRAESMSSTASCAVWLAVSNTGFTSVSSTDSTRPDPAIFSIARWLSR